MKGSRLIRRRPGLHSFTLVELLTVIVIIAILAALTLGAVIGAQNTAARGRAKSEVKGFEVLLENYKADNGTYPLSDGSLLTNTYATVAPTDQSYITNAQILFYALTGKTNYTDTTTYAKSYTNLRSNQVGNVDGSKPAYVIDPWGYAYGYSTGAYTTGVQTSQPYSGAGNFDLWSTGSDISGSGTTNKWIANFQ